MRSLETPTRNPRPAAAAAAADEPDRTFSLAAGAIGLVLVVAGVVLMALSQTRPMPWGGLSALAGVLLIGFVLLQSFKPNILWIAGRDLNAYFYSPMAYLVLLGMLAVTTFNYVYLFLPELTQRRFEFSGMENPMVNYISGNLLFWLALLFAVPVLTMRLFSEEWRTGTIEMLMTAPVTEGEVVLGKFLAGMVMYPLLWVPSAVYLIVLARYQTFDVWPVLAVYVGVMTTGAMFIAIGLFFSSLTSNQIIAAVLTFATLALMFIMYMVFLNVQNSPGGRDVAEAIKFVSVLWQMVQFALGKMDVRYLVFHLSVAIFALFVTIKVLEARKLA